MYAQFIADLCRFLIENRLAAKDELRGCKLADVAALENSMNIRLPSGFKEALCVLGNGSGKLMDGDAFGIEGIASAREVAQDITTADDSPWKLSQSMLPFMQHDGYTFHFIDLETADDDPPVWVYVESELCPTLMKPSFTCWLRECAIWCIEHTPWNDEVCREIELHRDAWMERKKTLDRYDSEALQLRQELLHRVVTEDRQRGRISTVLEIQERWNREFRQTDLCKTLLQEGKRIPWGWTNASNV